MDGLEVRVQNLKEVEKMFEAFPKELKQAKKEVMVLIGEELLDDLQYKIGNRKRKPTQRYLQNRPHMEDLQKYYVGSGKGYVAVRPANKKMLGAYSAGEVTEALEFGHKVPTKDGMGFVSGKYMYEKTAEQAEHLAVSGALWIKEEMEKILEGRT